jgi:hypothetical protein
VVVQILGVAIICSLFSVVFWKLLAIPGRLIASITPWIDCSRQEVGSVPMFLCSFVYAFTRILGPLVITVILVMMRNRIRRGAIALLDKVPKLYRFLGPPLAATAVFGITWAWAHEATASFSGILPQIIFPMVAGLFCYLGIRYTPLIQGKFDGLLRIRNRLPWGIRFLIALAVPLVVAISMTGQLTDVNKAQTEQTITLIGLVTGYVAMVPRSSASRKQVEVRS